MVEQMLMVREGGGEGGESMLSRTRYRMRYTLTLPHVCPRLYLLKFQELPKYWHNPEGAFCIQTMKQLTLLLLEIGEQSVKIWLQEEHGIR